MEKYAVPVAPIGENPKPITRSHWKRSLIELTGKCNRHHLHDVAPRLMQSYSEIGVFPHKYKYHNEDTPCKTHFRQYYRFVLDEPPSVITGIRQSVLGVSALEFDAKGIYLASVSKPGCLTVHEFESLYCQSNGSGTREDQGKQLLHIPVFSGANAVRWNPASQDEVVCTSLINNEVLIFDIGYVSSEPTEVLRKRPTVNVHGSSVRQGFSDIALSNDDARVLASDTYGAISIWDRRASNLPQSGLTTNAIYGLTSIQLDENQCVIGATKSGFIYIWDLRGGRSSAAFQSHKEAYSSPLTSVRLSSMLNKIGPLKAQSNILPKEIQSININPSCSYQLGFHLDDGWSGVLDLHNFQVSHIHCPPPPWLDESNDVIPMSPPRKASWLPKHSIYAVGSTSNNGLHLLDFYPHTSSPCHVDYDDSKNPGETLECKQNVFVPLSGLVTACATHPLNGTIVAGTVEASLLMISQKHLCKKGDDDDMMATLSIHDS
ncbi:putative transcription factor WD40-like family [Helianthus debilis subsp. tardiflorus]